MSRDFTRCPGCGCIAWPPSWPAIHRRTCPYRGTEPEDWSERT